MIHLLSVIVNQIDSPFFKQEIKHNTKLFKINWTSQNKQTGNFLRIFNTLFNTYSGCFTKYFICL